MQRKYRAKEIANQKLFVIYSYLLNFRDINMQILQINYNFS